VRGRDLAGVRQQAQKAIDSANVLQAGYYTEWGGQFRPQDATKRSIVVPVALTLIFVMLFLSNGSLGLAALIYLNVPFAITGGVFALFLRGMPLSISAGVGFIALFGVAVLNGLVLVSYIKQRRDEGLDAQAAAFEGARVRLRPVLMTALVAGQFHSHGDRLRRGCRVRSRSLRSSSAASSPRRS
jgi:cobalt-zinc-cadmium resistance protein CzcA